MKKISNEDLTLVFLSGGLSTRLRPLSSITPDTFLPKGLIRVMGLTPIEIQLGYFESLPNKAVYVVVNYLPNRLWLNYVLGDRTKTNQPIFYTPSEADQTNIGSGDALLRNIEIYGLTGNSIVVPTDNILVANFEDALYHHKDKDATVTVFSTPMRANDIIGRYGLIIDSIDSRVEQFVEKPATPKDLADSLEIKEEELGDKIVNINGGAYIVNNEVMVRVLNHKNIEEIREKGKFDIATHLIPLLIEEGYPIYTYPLSNWVDLGTSIDFLETIQKFLAGDVPEIFDLMRKKHVVELPQNIYIHEDTQKSMTGRLIEERIEDGSIGPNIYIGRQVRLLGNHIQIKNSSVEDGATIFNHSQIYGSYIGLFSVIGEGTLINDSGLGFQTIINSDINNPTTITQYSFIGATNVLPKGTTLENQILPPGYIF